MEYTVKTTLDTLSEAYIVLTDLGLAGVLDGTGIEIQPRELLDALFGQKKLALVLGIITGEEPAKMGNLRPSEALELIHSFFVDMSAELRSFPGIMATITTGKPAAEAKA